MKSLVGNHPNVWAFIQPLIGQEADTRRVFINNVSGMGIDENSGRTQHSQDNRERIQSVVLYFTVFLFIQGLYGKSLSRRYRYGIIFV